MLVSRFRRRDRALGARSVIETLLGFGSSLGTTTWAAKPVYP
jgi:hypothetical protein